MDDASMSWMIYAGVAVCFIGVIIYLAIHTIGLIRVLRSSDPVPISKISLAAWIVSFVGGFMGPLVILTSLLAIALGVVALLGDVSERSRICATHALAASLTIIFMTIGMLAFMIPAM